MGPHLRQRGDLRQRLLLPVRAAAAVRQQLLGAAAAVLPDRQRRHRHIQPEDVPTAATGHLVLGHGDERLTETLHQRPVPPTRPLRGMPANVCSTRSFVAAGTYTHTRTQPVHSKGCMHNPD